MDDLYLKFISYLANLEQIDQASFLKLQRSFARENKSAFLEKDKLLSAYNKLVQSKTIPHSGIIENLLKLKNTRSLSGIVVVSVLTKAYPCPNNCLYCPTQSDVPKSYLAKEPAVARAIMCEYSPYKQTCSRLKALKAVGHSTDKVNIRIIGGTWSYYSKQYQTKFVKECFRAANEFNSNQIDSDSLENLQTINETASTRIVEISIETRPDFINESEIVRLRKLGITKVELGIQSIYDEVLEFNNRGHKVEQTIIATKLLKDAGFKVSYQMMLNLPGSNSERDISMFKKLFSSPNFQPDHLKIYPLALVKEAEVYNLYQENKFKPYSKDELVALIAQIKKNIPRYCRIERVIRDIPAEYIVEGGAAVSNLRQVVLEKLKADGDNCKCIRCREIKSGISDGASVFVEEYRASGGKEFFLSLETKDREKLVSMLRLRLPDNNFNSIAVLKNAALVREIHTYGPQVQVGKSNIEASQHKGFGTILMKKAEEIASENGYHKIAVIAGVGVRGFFRKLGYELEDTYMVKKLNNQS